MSNIPRKVYLRYFLFQLPGTVILVSVMLMVHHNIGFDWKIFWIVLLVWIIKDIVMFPFIWRSYGTSSETEVHGLRGKKGTVTRKLDPEGYVRIGGELWRAVLDENGIAEKGERVVVISRQGITVRVKHE